MPDAACYPSIMALARRLTAVLAMLLLTQLVLVGSGFACTMEPMPGAAVPSTATVVDVESLQTTGDCPEAMPSSAASEGAPPPESDQAPIPCPLPWAPAGCHGVPCAPAAITASASTTPAHTGVWAAGSPALTALAPDSFVRAPELPPPRA